ncbi:MAG TPA: sugar ABC transporter permease [Nocardioides sp.]
MTDRRFAALMMAPAAAFLLAFVAWPLLRFVTNGFYDISPVAGGPREFVGLDNFAAAVTSSAFQGASWRTGLYTLIVVALEFTVGLGVALVFASLGSKSAVFRTMFMYPLMMAPVVAGLLWRFLLIDNFGIVNELLGIDVGWLSEPGIALYSVALPDVWLTTSFITLVLFAGLQNVPGEVIEAAKLDGARFTTMLFRIIIPLLRPVIAVALIVRGIDAARAFDIIVIQTNGGPQESTTTLSLLVYRTMTRYGDIGLASAMGTIYLLGMLLVASVAVFAIWRPGADA